MQFSIIYSVDCPADENIDLYAPPEVKELWDQTEDDGQYEYGYLEGRWTNGTHRKWCAIRTVSSLMNSSSVAGCRLKIPKRWDQLVLPVADSVGHQPSASPVEIQMPFNPLTFRHLFERTAMNVTGIE